MAIEEILSEETRSYLDMSDEEISEVDIGAVSPKANEAPVDTEADDTEEEEVAVVEPPVVDAEDLEDVKTDTSADTDPDDEEDTPVKPVEDAAKTDKPKAEPAKVDEKPADEIDYKAAYERLVAPFKANGKEIAVKGVDDAIELMQMGANYNKKMAALKPNLKIMKLLENNGLLDESKLSYLIDLDKKDPDAINKLIKDSGIDPLDLSADKAGEYKPKKYSVDDLEIELDTVLDELQDTPTYTKTLDIVSNKWDGPSKKVIANSPQILKVINSHVQSGIYDLIHAEMESERVYGRLNGLSDIEAYRQVGDAIQARGGFNHLGSSQGKTETPPVIVTPKPKPAEDDKLKDKKRAASTSKPAASSTGNADFNPLALSDDDFAKHANGKYV